MTDEAWARLAEANREERRAAREFTRKLHGSRRRGYKVKSTEKEAGLHSQPENGSRVESTTTLTPEQLFSQRGRAFVVDADAIAEAVLTQTPVDFAAVIRAVEPDAPVTMSIHVHQDWSEATHAPIPRTKGQAQKIAAGIMSVLPGTRLREAGSGQDSWLVVQTNTYPGDCHDNGRYFAIFYTPEVTP